MLRELFYDDFMEDQLDTSKWVTKGGIRGERGGLPWPLNKKFESGKMEIGNSILSLYGGGTDHDYSVRTAQTFNPFVDGTLTVEVRAYIARPNLEQDDVWFSFRVTEDGIDKYVPSFGIGAREKSAPGSLTTMWQLLTRKQTNYHPDYQLRFSNSIPKNLREEREGLSKIVVSNGFDIKEKDWNNLRIVLGKSYQAAYVNDSLAAEMSLTPAKTDYRFTLYAMNQSMLFIDKVRILGE